MRDRVLTLLAATYESDAEAERALALPPKTICNWRYGRSAGYMRILPQLASCLGVGVGELLDMPLTGSSPDLSRDELELLQLYREARNLPPELHTGLYRTLESVIRLYLDSYAAETAHPRSGRGKTTTGKKEKRRTSQGTKKE